MSTTAIRSTSKAVQHVSRRGFHATRLRARDIESPGYRPYHYPEGPRSSIPFDPLKKGFAFRYWTFMAVGFGLPFGIAVWQTYKPK